MVWIPSPTPSVMGWKIWNVTVERRESEERGELDACKRHQSFVGMVLLILMIGVGDSCQREVMVEVGGCDV